MDADRKRTAAVPDEEALRAAVRGRYGALATGAATLSCGAALDLAAPARGESVVDLGCGRGRDVIRAALLVGPAGRAIGVDASSDMLAAARAAVPATLPNATFVASDLSRVDLPDGCADVVISNCAINHAPDKEAVYREIHRLLRRGGRFVVSDVIAETTLPEAVRRDPAAWAGCYGGSIPEDEYLAAVRRAGFGEVDVVAKSAPYERGGVRVLSLTLGGIR